MLPGSLPHPWSLRSGLSGRVPGDAPTGGLPIPRDPTAFLGSGDGDRAGHADAASGKLVRACTAPRGRSGGSCYMQSLLRPYRVPLFPAAIPSV